MRGTIWSTFWSLRWRRCCAERTTAPTWRSLAVPRKLCCASSCGWSTASQATIPSAGYSGCSTRRHSNQYFAGSWRNLPRSCTAWWRWTAKPCAVRSSVAAKRRRCSWSTCGPPRRGLRLPNGWRPSATRSPQHWKPWSCWHSMAALSPPTRCTGVEQPEYPAESIVAWDAVLQPQELAQQTFLGTAKLRHVGAVVRSAQHRRQGNDQNVDQIVPRIVRSRVRHVLEKVLEFLHRTTPIPIRESSSESISPASATPPLWPNAIPLPTRGRVAASSLLALPPLASIRLRESSMRYGEVV